MGEKRETLEGYGVDLAGVRKYPASELAGRARAQTKACAPMGHCVESGYGLVGDDGRVAARGAAATPYVVRAVGTNPRDRGIRSARGPCPGCRGRASRSRKSISRR